MPGILGRFGNFGKALQFAYPDISWDSDKFIFKGKKSVQRRLKIMIAQLLPNVEILENFLHPEVPWGIILLFLFLIIIENFDRRIELDLWIPQHAVGIEYQGRSRGDVFSR